MKQSIHDINSLLMTLRLRNIRLSAKLEGIYRKDIYELPLGGFMPGVTLDKMKAIQKYETARLHMLSLI